MAASEGEVYYVQAKFQAASEDQLSLETSDVVRLIEKKDNGWWWVEKNGRLGYAPSTFLSLSKHPEAWQDEEYFDVYGGLKIHREMLSDNSRTAAYKSAFENGSAYFQGRTVMDVGCGTGICSLFCLSHTPAKKVFSVEASCMAKNAEKLLQANVKDHSRFCVLEGKAEDLAAEDIGKVDLIVSEWMGTFLLFEMVLESVLTARDKWLKEDGVMWPSAAQLFLVPCEAKGHYREVVEFWKEVYGFDFSPLLPQALDESCSRPMHNYELKEAELLGEPATILGLSVKDVQIEQLEEIQSEFSFQITKSGTFYGFASWFDVTFGDLPIDEYKDVILSTGPSAPLTHWKQDLFLFPHPFQVQKDSKLKGVVHISRNKEWRRHLRVDFNFKYLQMGIETEISHSFGLWR